MIGTFKFLTNITVGLRTGSSSGTRRTARSKSPAPERCTPGGGERALGVEVDEHAVDVAGSAANLAAAMPEHQDVDVGEEAEAARRAWK